MIKRLGDLIVGIKQLPIKTQFVYWLVAVAVSGFLAFYWDSTQSDIRHGDRGPESSPAAATFIPAGFVLVPIEVANFESLDSILGNYGVVDLYRSDPRGKSPPIKIAGHVKILRAPLNPSHFAVLAPENESSKLVSFTGPFTVVVQNPDRTGTQFVKEGMDGAGANHKSVPDRQKNLFVKPSRITVEVSDASDKISHDP